MEYVTKSMRLDEEVVAWLDKLKKSWGSYNKGLRLIAFAGEGRGQPPIDVTVEEAMRPLIERTSLDVVGPELSTGRGKATTETRGMRQKGDMER